LRLTEAVRAGNSKLKEGRLSEAAAAGSRVCMNLSQIY
jgi:hypothetical protein